MAPKNDQSAKNAEIPIFVFIDSDVDAEYSIYIKNYDDIENQKMEIVFHATKNINVFRFIRSIRRYSNIVINSFRKVSDIKEYLAGQWAGYFLNYLELRRDSKKNDEIEDSLDIMKRKHQCTRGYKRYKEMFQICRVEKSDFPLYFCILGGCAD